MIRNAGKTAKGFFIVSILILLGSAIHFAGAQQPQIPTLQVCNETKAAGKAVVTIIGRQDATHTGKFNVAADLSCAPSGYPAGTLTIGSISMTDSLIQGTVTAVTLEQITSTGKHTPTVYLNGRCKAEKIQGCRFWMMIADNKRSDQKGTLEVIIINCSALKLPVAPVPRVSKNIFTIANRALADIAINEIFNSDIREFLRINDLVEQAKKQNCTLMKPDGTAYRAFKTVLIQPEGDLGDTLDFSSTMVRARIDAGMRAAEKAFQGYGPA